MEYSSKFNSFDVLTEDHELINPVLVTDGINRDQELPIFKVLEYRYLDVQKISYIGGN